MVAMGKWFVVVVLLGACTGGGDGHPSVGYACDQMAIALCSRANECDLLGGETQETCYELAVDACCEDSRTCDGTARATDDELDTCVDAWLELGCDHVEAGERPSVCEPLFDD